MVPIRSFTVVLLLTACAFVSAAATARAQTTRGCDDAMSVALLPSPVTPWTGAPLRVLVAAERPITAELTLIAPDGTVAARSQAWPDGPPTAWLAEVASPAAGTWRASLVRDGCSAITRDIAVRADRPAPPGGIAGSVWPIRSSWNRATENLFSAWIEKLFDDPIDATPSWPALHEVLRDSKRNVLFNHLGLNEDSMKLIIRPDCADLPYFLRAYFAFKMGLPFGYSICSRGGGGVAPRCPTWINIQSGGGASAAAPPAGEPSLQPAPQPARQGLVASFARFLPDLANGVHSGSGRTAANDNNTDYYPVPLSQQTLRPGVVYHDPYGHVLMIVRRVAENNGDAGIILAVDGQPDGTVARKRFWRGNFLFAQNPGLGSPGFKRFRPIVRDQSGALRRLTNDETAKNPQYADFSLDQSKL
ncbi:MAG: hypothetical protein JO254_10355, partial [Pseudolabrys sp.]|nr:hypothetical protein [Pseudolabrys sp.]